MRRPSFHALIAAAALTTSGCSSLGSIGDILGAIGGGTGQQQQQQQGQIEAQVISVDQNSQRINLRASNGQNLYVRYDSRTMVVYRQEQYPVTSLRQGDTVTLQVQQISQNELYATRIDVR